MDSAKPSLIAPDVIVFPTMTDVYRDEQGVPILEGTVDVMLLRMEAGPGAERLVAVAFSTVVRLVEAMGEEQPWVAIPAGELEGTLQGSGAQAILLDPQLAEAAGVARND
jgi:hypothetical protein